MRKLRERSRKLKPVELRPFVHDYEQQLPGWRAFRGDCLGRAHGPVLQVIGFQRLSYRTYRPSGYVRVLVAPGSGVLHRVLRSSDARGHAHNLPKVVEAIRRDVVPGVDAPLIPEEVLELLEREAIPKSHEAYTLAALHAHLGHDERALYWCQRFPDLVDQLGLGWQKWDHERGDFLRDLEQWIDAGEAQSRLECVLEDERKKWGFGPAQAE
jgi:hypothetical protein